MPEKIMFVSPPRKFTYDVNGTSTKHPSRASIAALSILGALKNAGHEVVYVDSVSDGYDTERKIGENFFEFGLSSSELSDIISEERPTVLLGSSMFTAEQDCVDRLFQGIKGNFPTLPVILGGAHASMRPSWHFEKVDYDAIVIGEGERVIIDLVEIIKCRNRKPIAGVVYSGEEQAQHLIIEDFGSIPWAFDDILLTRDGRYRYTEGTSDARIEAIYRADNARGFSLYNSKGCPQQCNYCAVSGKDGTRVRHKGAQASLDQAIMLTEKYGVNLFHNQSDAFMVHPNDFEFLKGLAEYRKGNPNFQIDNPNAFFVRLFFPASADYELDTDKVDLLASAGFTTLTLAIETFVQRFNKKINFQHIPIEKIIGLLQYAKSRGLKTDAYMMYNFPTQTEAELRYDLSQIHRIRPHLDGLSYRSLVIFPGCAYYGQVVGTKITEQEYRSVVASYSYGHLPDIMNLTQLPTKKLLQLASSISLKQT